VHAELRQDRKRFRFWNGWAPRRRPEHPTKPPARRPAKYIERTPEYPSVARAPRELFDQDSLTDTRFTAYESDAAFAFGRNAEP